MDILESGEILTTRDAAKEIDLTPDRTRQLARSGRLPALRTRCGQYLFLEKDVASFKLDKEQRK